MGDLADELGAIGAQASDGIVDPFDLNMTLRRPSAFGGAIAGSISASFGVQNFVSSSRPWPSGGPHHDYVDLDTLEPVDAVHPRTLDRYLAFDRHTVRCEKSDSGRKVIDDNADVAQPLDCHVTNIAGACAAVQTDRGEGAPHPARLENIHLAGFIRHFRVFLHRYKHAYHALYKRFVFILAGSARNNSVFQFTPSFAAFLRYVRINSTQGKGKHMLHIIWSILVGFVVGLIARALVPGVEHMGFWLTSFVGIGGSIVGGLIARIFSRPKDGAFFHPAGFILSIIGAIILLVLINHFSAAA